MGTKQIIGHKTDGTTEVRGTIITGPRIATLMELLDAIPDARYMAWEGNTTAKARKYWNALHSQKTFTPPEWDAWGDKFETEGLLTSAQNTTFKAAKPTD